MLLMCVCYVFNVCCVLHLWATIGTICPQREGSPSLLKWLPSNRHPNQQEKKSCI